MVASRSEDSTAKAQSATRNLRLPAGKTVSLHVLEGPERGRTYVCRQPRVAIGRQNVDFNLDDPQVSQAHCVLEIMEERARLRDLDSANGTYVDDQPVREATLGHMSEFRVGDHTLVLMISPGEPSA